MAQNSNQYYPQLPSFPGGESPNSGAKRAPWDLSGSFDWQSGAKSWNGQTGSNFIPGVSVPAASSNYQQMPGFPPAASTDWANKDIGDQYFLQQSMYPGLSDKYAGWLQSMIGKGATPFNLQTQTPFGGMTQPGQLSAGANPLLQQLMNFFQHGQSGGMPGANTLATIANKGIDALPEWQKMIDAQQQNIGQNQANLREQFASMGGLAGSPFGNAMSNYEQQTTKDQNALLGLLQQQNILQGQLPAAQFLMQGAQGMGQYGQQLDQQSIDRMYNEFIRTRPEYSPLLQQLFGLSTTFQPALQKTSGGGILQGLLPGLMGAGAAGLGAGLGGAGASEIALAALAGF